MMSDGVHDEFLLGAYALDRLDPDESERAQQHLGDCGHCQTEFEELTAARQDLGRIPSGWLVHGPPAGSSVLEAAIRTIRASKAAASTPSRRTIALAAAIAGLAGTFSTGLLVGAQIQPTAGRPAVSAPAAHQATAIDPATGASLSTTITPAKGWVRVRATVSGIPPGESCRLLVLRSDGSREIAGSWVATNNEVVLEGSAAVPPDEVQAILVADTAGRTFIAVGF
jgi:anti-sigma factor RsiW